MKRNLISHIFLLVISIILPAAARSQSAEKDFDNYFKSLPKHLKLDEKVPQKYLMVTDYTDYDLFGNFIKKMRIKGEYTRGLKDGYVKWNNVAISHSKDLSEIYPEGENQDFMENFNYIPSQEILNESFFKIIPKADIYMKNLVWDMMTFEGFAWYKWDSLKLNEEFSTKEMSGKINLAGAGTFENKDICLTWTGITKTNNKICAIIKYAAMNNPLEIGYPNITIRGRSHYWGNIYVSLSDKQIEYAYLSEDVLLDIKIKGQETSRKTDAVRNITLTKLSN